MAKTKKAGMGRERETKSQNQTLEKCLHCVQEANKGSGPATDRKGGGKKASQQPKAEPRGQIFHGKLQVQELVMQINHRLHIYELFITAI